jgi:Uma2 family endonuclease
MSTVQLPRVQRVVLPGVDWRSYSGWIRLLDGRRDVRLNYDRGVLEIMTLSYGHESWGRLFCRLIVVLTEELGLPIASGGSTTLRRRKRRRGLESDECFWISNEPRIRGKDDLDLRVDPPPDLALEIDISRSSLDRMAIYAALGVPEIWRFDGTSLTFNVLGTDGKYASVATSPTFPGLTPADLISFLHLRTQLDENALIRQFRAWVRQHLVAGGGTTP